VSDEEWKKRVERAVEVSTYWFEKFHAANERIKRLEEGGDAMLNAWLMPEDSMEYCDWIALSADAKAKWYKAKEAKP